MGVEGLAALHLGELAVLALDGVAADEAVLADLDGSLAEAEAHAFEFGVAHLVLGGADAGFIAAGVAGHMAGTVPDGGAGAVHGGVAHTDDGDVAAQVERLGVGQVVDAKRHIAQGLALDVHGVGLPQTGTDEDAPVTVAEEIVDGDGLADGGVGAEADPLQVQVVILEVVQHTVGQTVVGDAVPHDAADLVAGVKDGDVVAPARQQHRDGQAGRAGTDHSGFHAVFGGGTGHHLVGIGGGDVVLDDGEVDRVVAGHPVADAVALALVLVVADQRADRGQGVVFEQHPACGIQLVCLEQTDDLRDVGVDGAALLTHRLFAAEAAVGFVQNMKCHAVPPLAPILGTLRCIQCSLLFYTGCPS